MSARAAVPGWERGGSAPDVGLIDPSWSAALEPVADQLRVVAEHLGAQVAAGRSFLPAAPDVFRAYRYPLEQVRVLVVGQDPYPTAGHSMGLAFSVSPRLRPVPASLRNIFTELHDDVGCAVPASGDLTAWAEQGVMLLNRVLTVAPGQPGSHRKHGWEQVTQRTIEALVERGGPLVAVLWGRDAQALQPLLGEVPAVVSVHPSPLSAYRGFFGSRPFSRINELLAAQGAEPVDWSLEAPLELFADG